MAPVEGFWGKPTSTLDWCEENYAVNFYVAEFWNTLSNLVMICAPLVMVFFGYKESHEKRFIYSFLSLAVVGTGSWLFHMTLLYSMQLMDEIPMIWGCSFQIYSLIMMYRSDEGLLLRFVLAAYCITTTLVYILVNDPIFHQVSYGIMVACIVLIAGRLIFTVDCHRTLFIISLFTYLLGFLLWNVDNIYCPNLRLIRNQPLGKSSGMLFECHAWWHIFAGFGTYIGLLFSVHTRNVYLHRKPQVKYLLGCWPYVSISEEGSKLS